MLASLTSDSCGDTPTEMLKGEGVLLQGFQNLQGNDHLQSSQTPHLFIHLFIHSNVQSYGLGRAQRRVQMPRTGVLFAGSLRGEA